MGGSSKKQTIGYKFRAGIHMILCHGPIDGIKKILVDDTKTLIDGDYTAGSYAISQESLFGGESSQGGISGTLDILDGSPSQVQNDYLCQLAQSSEQDKKYVPAYRGVASLVLHDRYSYQVLVQGQSFINGPAFQPTVNSFSGDRGMYLGMNPYLKTWKTLIQRIHKKSDGSVQWYDEKAAVGTVSVGEVSSIVFILDDSGSMTGDNLSNMKSGVNNILNNLLGKSPNIMIQAINEGVRTYFGASDDNINDAKSFVNSLVANGGTSAPSAYGNVANFFNTVGTAKGVVVTLSDGEMQDVDQAKAMIANVFKKVKFVGLGMGTVGSLSSFDNTGNPVQVLAAKDINGAIAGIFYTYSDMNPAHIIRECLTNDIWGEGKAESEIDDDSFKKAADTLYEENLGLSMTWTQESSIESFLEQVRNHINAVIYEDPQTGLTVLKLIRDDYDVSQLLLLNESNIKEVSDFQRSTFSELINQITVTYTNIATGEDGTITVQDTALVAMQNDINSKSVEYKGFSNIQNASKVAMRDLKISATPLISAELQVMRSVARNFRQGDVFKWSWGDYKVDQVVMRVLAVDLGNGKSNSVTLTCTQDIFAMPESTMTTVQPSNPVATEIAPITNQIGFDVPYLELVQRQGQSAVDAILANNPQASFFGVACGRPTTGVATQNAQLYLKSDASGNYLRDSNLDFCPTFTTLQDIGYLETEIVTASTTDFGLIDPAENLPVWAQLDDELVSITQIYADDTGQLVLTVKRGVLDTVPAKHTAHTVGYVWDVMNGGSTTEHVETEQISAKLIPSSLSQILDQNKASVLTATMQGRAYRPYPPANVKINDEYYPTKKLFGDFTISWVHRNRLQQTGSDYIGWTDSDVTLEAGVSYKLNIKDKDGNVLLTRSNISTNSVVLNTQSISAQICFLELFSVRNGIESYQKIVCELHLQKDGTDFIFDLNENYKASKADAVNFIDM